VLSKSIPTVCFSGAAGCAVPSLSKYKKCVLKVKYQQFTFLARGLTVPSLSQVQVELFGKVSQQFTFFLVQVVQFIVETQFGIVESKVSQQFLFLWCCRFVRSSLSQVQVNC
jgi:hypothetical protein